MPATMARKRQDVEVNFHCHASQKAAYEQAAARDGRSLSSWIRFVLDREAGSGVEIGEHLPKLPKKGE